MNKKFYTVWTSAQKTDKEREEHVYKPGIQSKEFN